MDTCQHHIECIRVPSGVEGCWSAGGGDAVSGLLMVGVFTYDAIDGCQAARQIRGGQQHYVLLHGCSKGAQRDHDLDRTRLRRVVEDGAGTKEVRVVCLSLPIHLR